MRGFSLIELMVAIAIIAILSMVAVPAYQNYLQTARESVLAHNISTMRIFQEDFRLRTGAYSGENWSPPAPGDDAVAHQTGWLPDQDGRNITYVLTAVGGTSYTVVATDGNTGASLTRTFP